MTFAQQEPEKTSVQLYYVYSHADGIFAHELQKHLDNLKRQGLINEYHSLELTMMTDGTYVFDEHLVNAQIILLLVSPDFLASEFCYGPGIQQALERNNQGEATVINILVRPVDWESSPLSDIFVLPDNEKPISLCSNEDEAYLNITEGIQEAITQLLNSQSPKSQRRMLPERIVTPPSHTPSTRLFLVYTRKDQNLLNSFEKHLIVLQRQGLIEISGTRVIGYEIPKESDIDPNLAKAQIILLFISPDFLASDYYDGDEMKQILHRQNIGDAKVVPIILRPCTWEYLFGKFPVPPLPSDGKALTLWPNQDTAFVGIVQGISKIITAPSVPQTPNDEIQKLIDPIDTLKHINFISGPIKVFYSYAHEDDEFLQSLQRHLTFLKRQMNIVDFSDHMIQAGMDYLTSINEALDSAHIILLLISADYFASNRCFFEMQRALERQKSGEAIIIPIILRPVEWSDSPIAIFKTLPSDNRPITTWDNRDEAFYTIAQGLREVILPLAARMAQETKEKFILEGKKHYDASHYEEALAAYQQAYDFDPKDVGVASIIGRILSHLGRYEEALTMYENLLHTSNSASAHLFKGMTLQKLGRLTEALESYQKAREYGFPG